MQKILILAALPDRLRLDKEIREIEEAIKRAVKRDSFEIKIRTAVRPQDIRRALAEECPQIVHFCGHGQEDGSLILEDDAGNHKAVLPTGLATLFKLHSDYVKCVLLNACYSSKPALVISKHINYVIGMNQPIEDRAAIVFAQGFYDGLGYDNVNNLDVISRAFDEGIVAIELENILQSTIPLIWKFGIAQRDVESTKRKDSGSSNCNKQETQRIQRQREQLEYENNLRTDKLEELYRLSRSRCISLWQAVGVTGGEAIALADDTSIGAPLPKFQPNNEKPLIIIIGDFGVGKSLLAQRLFQKAIKQTCENASAPIPIYLKAQQVAGQLQKTIEEEISKLGQSLTQGVTAIIDGADEAGSNLAIDLLNEARVIVNTWEKSTLVITSRPIRAFTEVEEAVYLLPLKDDEAYALIQRFSNQRITPLIVSRWPDSIQNAIRRPLFAILLGIYLKSQSILAPNSPGDLLSHLVEQALQQARTNNPNIEQILHHLAVLVTDHSKGLVSKTEVGVLTSELQILLESGLVVEDSGMISFPLPVLAQWFAAKSLAAEMVDSNELSNELGRLERWCYPLAILIGSNEHDNVSKILAPIVRKHPAFIAEIVSEELAKTGWNFTQSVSLPPSYECGKRIRIAMQSWIDGVSSLSMLIAPVREDNTLLPLGIYADEMGLTTSWYCGNENLPDIFVLPSSKLVPSVDKWPTVKEGKPSHKSAWAWQWTLNELVGSLSELLQQRMLPVNNGPIFQETIWQIALVVTRRIKYHYSPIPLSEIEEGLSSLPLNIFPSKVNEQLREYYLHQLMVELNHLRQRQEIELHCLWPRSDIFNKHEWMWESYSKQQLLARAKAVYTGAIEGYIQLVNTYFPKFLSRLETAVTMPAKLVGIIYLPQSNNEPSIFWYWEAQPQDQESYVDFRLSSEEIEFPDINDLHSRLNNTLLMLRREAATWIRASTHSAILDILKPDAATELAYDWLWNDLKKIAWVNGHIGNAPLSSP